MNTPEHNLEITIEHMTNLAGDENIAPDSRVNAAKTAAGAFKILKETELMANGTEVAGKLLDHIKEHGDDNDDEEY